MLLQMVTAGKWTSESGAVVVSMVVDTRSSRNPFTNLAADSKTK